MKTHAVEKIERDSKVYKPSEFFLEEPRSWNEDQLAVVN